MDLVQDMIMIFTCSQQN